MKVLFETVLSMSLKGSAVILAVLALRLLLSRAPKKYSFFLWSAAGFRLVCPVSFKSVISLFGIRLPTGDTAAEAGGAVLHGPGTGGGEFVTVRIPAAGEVKSILSVPEDKMPEWINDASVVKTDEMLLTIGMALWLAGITAMLIYCAVSYIRLKKEKATATLYEGNVFRSEKVSSPFILGLIRPKIYLPYGLEGEKLEYVLAHERYHIKRLDFVVKVLAFVILIVHWFNPLCWLAYYLMSRDMEMSCDEKVLSGGGNIEKAYSSALLDIAVGRWRPLPSPLAFGESGVKSRIKNVLKWKKPKLWLTVLAGAVCIISVASCAADPAKAPDGNSYETEKAYVSWECVYMSMLSSVYPGADSGCRYFFTEDAFVIEHRESETVTELPVEKWKWEPLPYSDREWQKMTQYSISHRLNNIDGALYQPLSDGYYLLKTEDELWLVESKENQQMGEYVWSVYSLVPEESMGSVQWEYRPTFSSTAPWLMIEFDMDYDEVSAGSLSGSVGVFDQNGNVRSGGSSVIGGAGQGIFWSPVKENGEAFYAGSAVIHFTVNGGDGFYNGSLYVTGEKSDFGMTYKVKLVGGGLAISLDGETGRVVITRAE